MSSIKKLTLEFEHNEHEAGSARALVGFLSNMSDVVKREIVHVVEEAGLTKNLTVEMREGIALNGIKALAKVHDEMRFLVWCAVNDMSFPEHLREGTVTGSECSLFKQWLQNEKERKRRETLSSMEIDIYGTVSEKIKPRNRREAIRGNNAPDDAELKLLYGEFCRLPIKDRQAVCCYMKKGL